MEVKDIIKEKRIELNMTMKELADKVGVSEGTISRWESGEIANMKRDKIMSLARALSISPAVIMEWNVPETSHNDSSYYTDSNTQELAQFLKDNPDYKVLFDATRKVKVEDIEIVKNILDKFSE